MKYLFKSALRYAILICVLFFSNAFMASEFLSAQEPEVLKVKKSPCLWVDEDVILHLKDKLHTPYMKSQAKKILADADMLINFEPIKEKEAVTYQMGTRAIASHLQTLTAAWVLTHEKKYREAAMKHLANLLNWFRAGLASQAS